MSAMFSFKNLSYPSLALTYATYAVSFNQLYCGRSFGLDSEHLDVDSRCRLLDVELPHVSKRTPNAFIIYWEALEKIGQTS